MATLQNGLIYVHTLFCARQALKYASTLKQSEIWLRKFTYRHRHLHRLLVCRPCNAARGRSREGEVSRSPESWFLSVRKTRASALGRMRLQKSATHPRREDCRVVSSPVEIDMNPEGSSAAKVGLRLPLGARKSRPRFHSPVTMSGRFPNPCCSLLSFPMSFLAAT